MIRHLGLCQCDILLFQYLDYGIMRANMGIDLGRGEHTGGLKEKAIDAGAQAGDHLQQQAVIRNGPECAVKLVIPFMKLMDIILPRSIAHPLHNGSQMDFVLRRPNRPKRPTFHKIKFIWDKQWIYRN